MIIEKQKQEYFLSIQLLRGIAAFMVMICHSPKGFEAQHPDLTAFVDPLGAGVNTFLVISGFIIPYSMYRARYQLRDFKTFMAKRLVRLEPPYIVSIIFILLLNYANTLTPSYHGEPYSTYLANNWGFILRHLAYINTFTGEHWLSWVYWTLAVEFQFYLLLSLIFPLLTHKNKKIKFGIFYGLLSLSWITVPGHLYYIFYFLPLFLMGISLFYYMTDQVTTKEFYMLLIPTYAMFCFACWYSGNMLIYRPLDFIVSIGALPCIYYIKKVPKVFLWLGSISYSIYLTHMFLTSRFITLYDKYMHLGFYVSWVLCIISCTIVGYVFYLAIEKPFLNLSKKIKIRH